MTTRRNQTTVQMTFKRRIKRWLQQVNGACGVQPISGNNSNSNINNSTRSEHAPTKIMSPISLTQKGASSMPTTVEEHHRKQRRRRRSSLLMLILLLFTVTTFSSNLIKLVVQDGHCLQTTQTTTTTTTTEKPSLTTRANDTNNSDITNSDVNGETNGSTELLLLSGEDFVDSREVPSILFDGTTNNNDQESTATAATTTTRPNSEKNNFQSNETSSSHQAPNTQNSSSANTATTRPASAREPTMTPTTTATATTTTAPTTSEHPQPKAANVSESSPGNGEADGEPAEGEEDQEAPGNAETDSSISGSDGGTDNNNNNNNNDERVFEPPQNISQYMDYIEKLFHDLRHQITDLFEPHLPQLIRTSQMVELSSSCSYDMLRMALALRQFEPWALKMIDSSGKVPEGIFEGTFSALGSYDECLNTVFPHSPGHTVATTTTTTTTTTAATNGQDTSAANNNNNNHNKPTQGQYCLVAVSPFMPPKPPVDKVDRLFQEEANRRNYTKDDKFSRLSPMFYYMKFRIGVCIPSTCHQQDMDSISSALSSSLRLNITIPDCRMMRRGLGYDEDPLTGHQLAGGLIFGLVCACVVAATLIDFVHLKLERIKSKEAELFAFRNLQHQQHHHHHEQLKIRMAPSSDGGGEKEEKEEGAEELQNKRCHDKTFSERLIKHWSWMSFSLLANFRLYFRAPSQHHKSERHQQLQQQQQLDERNQKQTRGQEGEQVVAAAAVLVQSATTDTKRRDSHIISCLNGIRVLSLCWVIVANSYLTLDPRATKRLTKTREAPRDLLFQIVVQASLAIETFFFLSGMLVSLSFARQFTTTTTTSTIKHQQDQGRFNTTTTTTARRRQVPAQYLLKWVRFYVHRYVRMTPPTMLVIAFSMWAYHYGDGPLWHEATTRVHESCTQNWWRHLLHVANFIDTRQMCFVHFWYIAADMQLFLVAPILMLLLYKYPQVGYLMIALMSSYSIGSVFYTTYARNLPPTLLFYSTDPESRREFGNTIMTKPFTHVLPYLVGMLVGRYLLMSNNNNNNDNNAQQAGTNGRKDKAPAGSMLDKRGEDEDRQQQQITTGVVPILNAQGSFSFTGIFGSLAFVIALVELFLPYKWNNSHLPGRLCASIYAALFRFGWSLVLAFVVISCRHRPARGCELFVSSNRRTAKYHHHHHHTGARCTSWCFCGSGGNHLNKLLGLNIFTHLSKLSFVAYLVHLPLMSVFIGQTRGLFAFSHTLVIHLAISYLVMSFALAFMLAHVIEFPFITFERLLFDKLSRYFNRRYPEEEEEEEEEGRDITTTRNGDDATPQSEHFPSLVRQTHIESEHANRRHHHHHHHQVVPLGSAGDIYAKHHHHHQQSSSSSPATAAVMLQQLDLMNKHPHDVSLCTSFSSSSGHSSLVPSETTAGTNQLHHRTTTTSGNNCGPPPGTNSGASSQRL